MSDNAVTTIDDQPRAVTPLELMQEAMQRGLDAESLRALMELQREWKADRAREAFTAAMTAFKAEPLQVKKGKHVRFETQKGVTEYDHATLAQVVDAVVSALSQHGLSHRWETQQSDNGLISVTCIITHELGHSERTTLSASSDDSGGKNKIQAVGSTVTYLQRYTLMAATGLAAHDMDDDGRGADPVETVSAEQVANLEALITEVGADKAAFLRVCKVEQLEDLPAAKYDGAVKKLEAKRQRAQ